MRVFARRALTLATVASIGVLWSGCSAKEQSEYVTGISTQMNVPRDLREIRVSVSVGGFRQFCRGYKVYNGKVQLPRSLGVHALNNVDQSGPVTFGIVGYDKGQGEGTEFADEECDVRVTKANDPGDDGVKRGIRLLRRSRQPYVKDEILFLPMPLKYACMDVHDCKDTDTCKAGRCVAADTDPATLPRFNPDMVDGKGGACFRASQCFAAAAPAIPVDADKCLFAVANTKDEPPLAEGAPDPIPGPSSGDGVNVELTWDGGYTREILDKEKDEGFIIPDPAHPQQFQLTAGLCDFFKGFKDNNPANATAHRITAIRASGTCQAKSPFQPICEEDQLKIMGADKDANASDTIEACKATELKPPRALLMLIVDNTVHHDAFFGTTVETVAVGISLSDPAFEKTDIGLVYAQSDVNSCDVSAAAKLNPTPARQAKDQIIDLFKIKPTVGNTSDWQLDAALTRATKIATADGPDYYKRAFVVIGNRDFAKDTCINNGNSVVSAVPPTTGAKPINTYVVLLANTPNTFPNPLQEANAVAAAGGTGTAVNAQSAGGSKADAFKMFQTIVKSLATCVYDIPQANAPAEGDVLSYTDPLFGTTKTINHTGACNAETAAADGWGFSPDKKKIFVCGNACEGYRNVLSAAQAVNVGFQKAAPPIPMFSQKAQCAPKPTP